MSDAIAGALLSTVASKRDERRHRRRVAVDRRIEADDEECDAQADLLERVEGHRQERRQIRRPLDPPLVAADLHVRPEIVDVERDAAQRALRHWRQRVRG